MNRGDRAYIMVNISALISDDNGLATRTKISGQILPEVGSTGIFEVTSPAVFIQRVVDLW
jgi:archaellin